MKLPTIRLLLAVLAGGLLAAGAARAQTITLSPFTDPAQLKAFTDQARQVTKAQKTQIIGRNIFLKEDEAARFWPLFDEYLRALDLLLDERVVLLQYYSGNYYKLDDKQAAALVGKVFDLEEKRTRLKRTWFKKFAAAVSPKQAALFFQIENQINATLDLQLLGSLPLIQ